MIVIFNFTFIILRSKLLILIIKPDNYEFISNISSLWNA